MYVVNVIGYELYEYTYKLEVFRTVKDSAFPLIFCIKIVSFYYITHGQRKGECNKHGN